MPMPMHDSRYRRYRIPVHLGHLGEQTTCFKFCEAAAALESFASAKRELSRDYPLLPVSPFVTFHVELVTKAGSSAQVCAVDVLHHYVELSAKGEGIMDLQRCERDNNNSSTSPVDQLPAFTTPGCPRSFIRLRTCFGYPFETNSIAFRTICRSICASNSKRATQRTSLSWSAPTRDDLVSAWLISLSLCL